MNPVTAQSGYSLPRYSSSAVTVEKQPRTFKNFFRRKNDSENRGSKTRKGSIMAKTGRIANGPTLRNLSLVEGTADNQRSSLFFSKLPLEIRLIIYNMVIGSDIYHFRNFSRLTSYRCPRGVVRAGGRKIIIVECENGHPWTERPMSLVEARKDGRLYESKAALLQSCKLAYIETFDLLYRNSRFISAGPEHFLSMAKTIHFAGLERITFLELRSPDVLTWFYRLEHPRQNRVGYEEWMDCLTTLKTMKSLRSLYVIVPNAYHIHTHTGRKHKVETERNLLGHFKDLEGIPDFIVWIAWHENAKEDEPSLDTEAERYAFKIVRYSATIQWPPPMVRSDEA